MKEKVGRTVTVGHEGKDGQNLLSTDWASAVQLNEKYYMWWFIASNSSNKLQWKSTTEQKMAACNVLSMPYTNQDMGNTEGDSWGTKEKLQNAPKYSLILKTKY